MASARALKSLMSYVVVLLLMVAIAGTAALAGGRQLALCLPGYGILACAAILSWWPARRKPIPRGAGECLLTATIFFAYIAGRAFFSPEEYLARRDLYLAMGALVTYLLTALCVPSPRARMWLVAGLLLLGLANCGVGAIQFFKGQNYMPFPFLPRADYGTRASGFFGYPNHLATFLCISLMMGLAVTFWSRWPVWAKILTGYSSLMCLLGLLITGSRGGYIGAAIGLLVFGLLSLLLIGKLASGRVIVLIIAGSLGVAGLAWGVQHLKTRSFLIESRTAETLTVDSARLRLWQAAWKQFQLKPVVGTGSGTYLYYGRQFRHPTIQKDPVYTHNEYIQLLAEYGILGIAAAVMFLETHLRRGWNSLLARASETTTALTTDRNTIAITVGGLSAMAAVMSHAFMEYNLHMPANALAMAAIFGLLAGMGTPDDEALEEGEERPPDWPAILRLGIPLLGVWIGAQAIRTWPAEVYAEKARFALSDWKMLVEPEVPRKVESLARLGLERDIRNPDLHFLVAEAHAALAFQAKEPAEKSAEYEKSLEAYEKALALAPRDVRLLLAKAQTLDKLQRFEEAATVLDQAEKLDPISGGVHYAHGAHLQAMGQLAEAGARYHRSVHLGHGPGAQAALDEVIAELKAGSPARPTNR